MTSLTGDGCLGRSDKDSVWFSRGHQKASKFALDHVMGVPPVRVDRDVGEPWIPALFYCRATRTGGTPVTRMTLF